MRARHPRGARIRALTPIVRRLHLQEIQRLRRAEHRLSTENERLQNDCWDADARTEMFQDALFRAENIELGLTMSGELLVAPKGTC